METQQQFKRGEICTVKENVNNYRKVSQFVTHVLIYAGAEVSIVSVSGNMAIVNYGGQSFSTRLDNLTKKKKAAK